MAMIRNGKVYRNLEEQVLKNMDDIETLSEELGTQVVANPEGEATEDLRKIQIGDDIYSIPNGGSGNAEWGDIDGDINDQLDLKSALDAKQNTLTAGSNITIENNVISATNTTYSNLPAEEDGTDVSLVTTGDKYLWNNKQDELVAGANITIVGNVISATGQLSSASWGQITGTLADQTDLKNALDAKQDLIDSSHKLPASNVSGLSTVATSGNYNDLSNKPTIPDAVSGTNDGTNWTSLTIGNDTYGLASGGGEPAAYLKSASVSNNTLTLVNKDNTSVVYTPSISWSDVQGKPSFATVATSGDYNDLTNKPIIPVDTNTWRAIKVNGTQVLDGQVTGNALDLVAGSNVTLSESNGVVTISSTGGGGGGSYSAGDGITISSNVIAMSYPMIIFLEEGD